MQHCSHTPLANALLATVHRRHCKVQTRALAGAASLQDQCRCAASHLRNLKSMRAGLEPTPADAPAFSACASCPPSLAGWALRGLPDSSATASGAFFDAFIPPKFFVVSFNTSASSSSPPSSFAFVYGSARRMVASRPHRCPLPPAMASGRRWVYWLSPPPLLGCLLGSRRAASEPPGRARVM